MWASWHTFYYSCIKYLENKKQKLLEYLWSGFWHTCWSCVLIYNCTEKIKAPWYQTSKILLLNGIEFFLTGSRWLIGVLLKNLYESSKNTWMAFDNNISDLVFIARVKVHNLLFDRKAIIMYDIICKCLIMLPWFFYIYSKSYI